MALYFALSILASPAATIKIAPSFTRKDKDLAMRSGSQPSACAANSTVAELSSNSCILCSTCHCAKWRRTFQLPYVHPPTNINYALA